LRCEHAFGATDAAQHDHELLAAVSPCDVLGAQALSEDGSKISQHGIAARMPVRIVHALEVVDVEHQDRERRRVPERESDLGVEAFFEVACG